MLNARQTKTWRASRRGVSTGALPFAERLDGGGAAVAGPAVELGLVLERLAARARDGGEDVGAFGEAGHVAPEFFELGNWIDVFLAVAPALFHVLQCDVGGDARGHRADGGGGAVGVGELGAREPEEREQAVDVDPEGVVIVISEIELVGLAREGETFDEAYAPIDAGEATAVVFDAARDDFPAEGGVARLEPADEGGIEGGAERVDVVDEQRAELRASGEQAGEGAVF